MNSLAKILGIIKVLPDRTHQGTNKKESLVINEVNDITPINLTPTLKTGNVFSGETTGSQHLTGVETADGIEITANRTHFPGAV